MFDAFFEVGSAKFHLQQGFFFSSAEDIKLANVLGISFCFLAWQLFVCHARL